MEIEKLKVFLSVVDSGSFSKAAEKLDYSPAGISYIVTAIEEELGLQLISRSYSGIRLNANGEALIPEIRRTVAAYDSFQSTAKARKNQTRRVIHIAAIDTIATKWLPEAVYSFQREYPDISIDQITGDPFEINNWIDSGTADIGFTERKWASPDYHWIQAYRDPFYGVFPKDEDIHDPCSLNDFDGRDFFIPDYRRDRNVPILLTGHSVKVNFLYDRASTPSIIKSIAIGHGSTILSALAIDLCSLDSSDSKYVPKIIPLKPDAYRDLGISIKDESLDDAIREFINYFKRSVNDDLPNTELFEKHRS